MTVYSPSSRPETIETLIAGVDRYNPTNVSILEDYLLEQSDEGHYDLLANLAILKLYQFNPDLVPAAAEGNSDDEGDESRPYTIFLILLKALAHQPFGSDFNLCLALLGDQMSPEFSSEELISSYSNLRTLSEHLRSRQFPTFWSSLPKLTTEANLSKALEAIPDFKLILRTSIARDVVRPLFKAIDKKRFSAWLGLEDEDLNEVLGQMEGDWTVEGELVQVPVIGAAGSEEQQSAISGVNSKNAGASLEKLSKLLKQTVQVA